MENELSLLDKKYIAHTIFYGNGKPELYCITPKSVFKPYDGEIETEVINKSVEELLTIAGKDNNTPVDPAVDKEDLVVINKYYKKFGGYVTLL